MIRFLQTPDETREYDEMTDLLVVYASAQDPSYFPTDNELLYIVSTLLVTPAKDQCIAKGVDMGSTDWNRCHPTSLPSCLPWLRQSAHPRQGSIRNRDHPF